MLASRISLDKTVGARFIAPAAAICPYPLPGRNKLRPYKIAFVPRRHPNPRKESGPDDWTTSGSWHAGHGSPFSTSALLLLF